MMRILLIDDDTKYCDLVKDHMGQSDHNLVFVHSKDALHSLNIQDFELIIMDHTLQWARGVDEILRLSQICKSDFALVSTGNYLDNIFENDNVKNPRITGIFGKYELDKLDSWLKWSLDKISIALGKVN